jgi:hypothetical protein
MLLNLLLAFFVGERFYSLAHRYDERPLQYAVLGISTFFGAIYAGEIFIDLLNALAPVHLTSVFWPSIILNTVLIPLAILCCWRFYLYLKQDWVKYSQKSMAKVVSQFGNKRHISNLED